MEAPPVQTAYLPFAQTLRAGGFSQPAEGWNAGQIGAHISMSNDLFSELADQIRAGGEPSFDNAAVSDPATLLAHAEGHGGLDGLADAIEASAAARPGVRQAVRRGARPSRADQDLARGPDRP